MDTNRLKRFATEARNILMQGVRHRLLALGFDLSTGKPTEMPHTIEGGAVFRGDTVSADFYRRWMSLRSNICARGLRQVAEEAAYTWFNRFVAIRIMQKQGFISPVLAYESEQGRVPVIVSEARQGRMPHMATDVCEKLTALLDDDGKTNEQFALLIVAYCHENPIINQCFGQIADYTELLLPQNILAEGGFVSMLNRLSREADADFRSAELIGWLYQFYISDRKDEAFAKKGKYDASEIAPATQIFTPNWIVKYMVENTVGRIYIDNNPYCEVKDNLKYLVDTPQGGNGSTLRVADLAELTVTDLACGSGHILNECFDLLYNIYVEEGYSRSQAIKSILRKNLLGIDLDMRAKQLATFALLMKACQKDTTFLNGRVMPRVYNMPRPIAEAIAAEGDTRTAEEYLRNALPDYLLGGNADMLKQLTDAILLMNHADTLGSIMQFNIAEQTRNAVLVRTEEYEELLANGEPLPTPVRTLLPYMRIILALTTQYAALCMNPPYMGSGRFDEVLAKYVKKHYELTKKDLCTVFMDVAFNRLQYRGKMGFINQSPWANKSSYNDYRKWLLGNATINTLLDLGSGTFNELSGEVVQSLSFVMSKAVTKDYGLYYNLADGSNSSAKETLFLETKTSPYKFNLQNILLIPGHKISYNISEAAISAFKNGLSINSLYPVKKGLATGNDKLFLRTWNEVSCKDIDFHCTNVAESKKWITLCKGGGYRKWYGNIEYVINWENNGNDIKKYRDDAGSLLSRPQNIQYMLQEAISYNIISSRAKGFVGRYLPPHLMMTDVVPNIYGSNIYSLMPLLNSVVGKYFCNILCPSYKYETGYIGLIPLLTYNKEKVEIITKQNITISRQDWDAHETSWDFEQNPLVALAQQAGEQQHLRMADLVAQYEEEWTEKFRQLHANEEELNRQFISIYGLEDELTPDVPLSEITILQQGEISIE